jgi:thiol-disulfide isomerase/thioredoxin
MKKLILAFLVFANLTLVQAQTGYKPGDKANDFNLKGIDGKMHSIASLSKGKGAIVIFTCNHCPFSQAYEQRIIAIHKKYAPKGIPVVAINPNDPTREPEDSYENMVKRAKKFKYPFAYLVDETQAVAKMYGATRTPHVFVLNKSNEVIYIGAIDDNFEEPKAVKEKYLEIALDSYLAKKPIANPSTKAIGCGIKWKK